MVPSRRGSWKLVNGKEQKNPAVSRFFTAGLGLSNIDVTNFISTSSSNGNDDVLIPKTLILFHPYTGKTHQLRVAAKSLGLPILGDTRYGTSTSNYNRTFLHALAIHVKVNNEDIAIWNPPSWFERRMPASEGKVDANNIQEGKKEGDCALHIMEKIVRKHCDDDFILNNIPLS
jgi:tRNA pseudouridine32 synthase/23S rRNA pseudouridine746 synthase